MKIRNKKSHCFLLLIFTLAMAMPVQGQFLKKLGKAAERAAARTVERRVENETSEKTDAALDSILEPGSKSERQAPQPPEQDTGSTPDTPSIDSGSPKEPGNQGPKALSVYSKFDFVPGDKPLFFEDFSNDFVGDFPAKWNTDGGGEVVLIGNDKWLDMKMSSYYIPDVGKLPEEYTIEFDLYTTGVDTQTSSQAKMHVILDESDAFGYGKNAVYAYLPFALYVSNGIRMWGREDGKVNVDNRIDVDVRDAMSNTPHISIAVNKQRFRLWVNETKYVDIPRIVPAGKITTLKFEPEGFKDGKERLFISNLKVAEGGVDLRRKLISEGKISTNAILFESNSANLKPESMGMILQISQVLQQEGSMNLKIVGHTDADGPEDANLALSKARAASVKEVLTNIYGISANRLSTEGKGESDPVGDNATADGKAQNRRVEFIKQ